MKKKLTLIIISLLLIGKIGFSQESEKKKIKAALFGLSTI